MYRLLLNIALMLPGHSLPGNNTFLPLSSPAYCTFFPIALYIFACSQHKKAVFQNHSAILRDSLAIPAWMKRVGLLSLVCRHSFRMKCWLYRPGHVVNGKTIATEKLHRQPPASSSSKLSLLPYAEESADEQGGAFNAETTPSCRRGEPSLRRNPTV